MIPVFSPTLFMPKASGAAFNPTSLITGNGGFWRADVGVTGTTTVTAWADQSTFGNNMSQVSAISQGTPSWSATGFNGAFPAVSMSDGTNQGLGISSFSFTSTTVTAFFLEYQNSVANSFGRYCSLTNGDSDFSSADAFEMDDGAGPAVLNCTHSSSQVGNGGSTGPSITASTAWLLGVEFDGTNGTRWSAGSAVGSPTSVTSTLGGATATWAVGKTPNSNGCGASYAFVGLTQKALNTTDWTNLKNFANSNWGTSF